MTRFDSSLKSELNQHLYNLRFTLKQIHFDSKKNCEAIKSAKAKLSSFQIPFEKYGFPFSNKDIKDIIPGDSKLSVQRRKELFQLISPSYQAAKRSLGDAKHNFRQLSNDIKQLKTDIKKLNSIIKGL